MINTFGYCFRQGLSNLRKNIGFSLASVATVTACIFLFGIFYAVITNVQHIVYEAENTVGMTVFFEQGLDEAGRNRIEEGIRSHGSVKEIRYVSADEAWKNFQSAYFGDEAGELSEAFADDNPLKGSDSFEVFLNDISGQLELAAYTKTLPGVREVNYSNTVVSALKTVNRVIYGLSAIIIGILVAVSIFLISNTISTAAAFRKREHEILKLMGATNFFVRAPFVVEGTCIGLVGAAIPVAALYFIYGRAERFLEERVLTGGGAVLSGIFQLLPSAEVLPKIALAGFGLGVGMGFLVSFITIRRHLRV